MGPNGNNRRKSMKTQRFLGALTVINLVLFVVLLTQLNKTEASDIAPVLRGRALEIVDAQGRIRAEINVEAPTTQGGQTFPDRVQLRLADTNRRPVVKMVASEEGSAVGFSDDANGLVELFSTKRKGNFVKVTNKEGKVELIKP
jgi:hypothetical protein